MPVWITESELLFQVCLAGYLLRAAMGGAMNANTENILQGSLEGLF